MTSLTRGHNKCGRKPISGTTVRKLMALRKSGLTAKEVSYRLGIGESTVKRYSSDWYQSNKLSAIAKMNSSPEKKSVTVKAHKRGDSFIPEHTRGPRGKPNAAGLAPSVSKAKPKTLPKVGAVSELTSEQIEYINNIYRDGVNRGTAIGNFFIKLGRLFGGNDSV